jgi:hypothetical protein
MALNSLKRDLDYKAVGFDNLHIYIKKIAPKGTRTTYAIGLDRKESSL